MRCGRERSPATVFSSADGVTWTPLAASNLTNGAGRITLSVGAPGDAVVYAYAANSCDAGCDQKDLYRSTDGGYIWSADPSGKTYVKRRRITVPTVLLIMRHASMPTLATARSWS